MSLGRQWAHRLSCRRAACGRGDPCGTLLFALTLQGAIETTNAAHGNAAVLMYVDDCVLLGLPSAIVHAGDGY
jgi:hypothetical protein